MSSTSSFLLLPSFRARRTTAKSSLFTSLARSTGGDASTLYLAKIQEAQDPAMAALKNTSAPSSFVPGSLARGRDGYLNFGACRTKPGQSLVSSLLRSSSGPYLVASLLTLRISINRSSRLSSHDFHELLRQDRVLDPPRNAGSSSLDPLRTHLHIIARRWRG